MRSFLIITSLSAFVVYAHPIVYISNGHSSRPLCYGLLTVLTFPPGLAPVPPRPKNRGLFGRLASLFARGTRDFSLEGPAHPLRQEHEDLLKKVASANIPAVSQPSDYDTHLHYSAFLEEMGAIDRAHFIRIQVAIDHIEKTSPWDLRIYALHSEESDLLRKHPEWRPSNLGRIASIQFQRGFIDLFETTGTSFLEPIQDNHFRRENPTVVIPAHILTTGDLIFERIPTLRGLKLHSNTHQLKPILDFPATRQLTALHIAYLHLLNNQGRSEANQAAAEIIAGHENLHNLRMLKFDDALGYAGMRAITVSPHLKSLEYLDVFCDPGAIPVLARSPNMARLKTLRIRENRLGAPPQAMLEIASSLTLTNLEHLELGDFRFQHVETFANSTNLQKLKRLVLNSHLSPVELQILMRSPHLQALQHLEFYMGDSAALYRQGVAIELPSMKSLKSMSISANSVREFQIFNDLRFPKLESLKLNCTLNPQTAAILANSPNLKQVKVLDFGFFPDKGILETLAQSNHLSEGMIITSRHRFSTDNAKTHAAIQKLKDKGVVFTEY